jgi:hypothetical protein
MTAKTDKPHVNEIALDPKPKGERKALGGGLRDQWNDRLTHLVITALPINQQNTEAVSEVGTGAVSGMVDMKPADPIEGVLISQIVVANEAAMKLYRLAWVNSEHFEASTKYLQLADKAARTVAMLTERLDHHRNQGKQQIVVQHTTTVNADQAVIANSVVSGKAASSARLLAAVADQPMEILEPTPNETSTVEGGGTKTK